MSQTASFSKLYSWQAWACLLVTLYITVALVGWSRTLIPDEIRPLLLTAKPIAAQLEHARLDLVQTPLSYIVGRLWLQTLGQTDNAAKALVLLTSIPTLVLGVYLAKQVTSHYRLAAFLFSVPYLRIGSSVNLVRMYGLLLLLTVTATLLWERWRREPSVPRLVTWIAVMTLAVYTHGSALLLLPAFAAISWLYGSRRWAFILATAVPILTLVPWIAYVLPVFLDRGIDANVVSIRKDPNLAVAQLPFNFLSGEDPGGASPQSPLYTSGVRQVLIAVGALVNLALLFVAGQKIRALWPPWRDGDDTSRWFWTLTLLCGMPVVLLYGFSRIFMPVVHARYLLIVLPSYWLLLVLLGEFGGRMGRFILYGIIIPWVLGGIVLVLGQHISSSTVHGGMDYVARAWSDSDLILCDQHMPLGWQVYWEWTRRLGRADDVKILSSKNVPYWLNNPQGIDMERIDLRSVNRVWFFHRNTRKLSTVRAFLGVHGFVVKTSDSVGLFYLTAFSKVDSPFLARGAS